VVQRPYILAGTSKGYIEARGPAPCLDQSQHRIDHRSGHPRQIPQFLDGGHQRVDLQWAAPLQILQHGHLVPDQGCGDGQPALHHVGRYLHAERLVHRLGLEHHGFAQLPQRGIADDAVQSDAGQHADRIETNIAPQLEPKVPTDIVAYGRVETRLGEHPGKLQHAARPAAIGFSDDEPVQVVMDDHARFNPLAGRLDHAADRTARLNGVPLAPAGIHRLKMMPLEAAAGAMKVPPGNSVHRGEYRRSGTQQRRECGRAVIRLMRLERAYHDVLHPKSARVLGGGNPRHFLRTASHELEAVLLNGPQMCTAGDEAYVLTRRRQFYRHISAYRAGAIHAESHLSTRSNRGCKSRPRAITHTAAVTAASMG